jgi:hypothetical protein
MRLVQLANGGLLQEPKVEATAYNKQSLLAPRAGRGPSGQAVHSGRRFARPLAGAARQRL